MPRLPNQNQQVPMPAAYLPRRGILQFGKLIARNVVAAASVPGQTCRAVVLILGAGSALLCGLGAPVHGEDPPHVTFEKDIRPIFREFCFDCHGATSEFSGGLDLRLVRLMLAGGDSGPAIEQGSPDGSYLLDRVRNGEMPPGEVRVPEEKVALLERWIAGGARTARPEPDPASLGVGIPLTEEERSFWAYQPIRIPKIPEYSSEDRVRTPIDALIRAAMPEGLRFSPDADRRTLIFRVYFVLTGLSPTLEEMDRWQTDARADWYERLVDDVLASPHYGEHWGRHWLDVAGYADSEGYTVADAERPWAWKYRDYVIRSLNADKPFDRFLHEQIAGDELAGQKQGDWTPEQIELLTATGFLRMAADGTGNGDNSPEARNKVIADTLQIVSSSLLGVSMACAQCHDHRYDPIPQTDYFAMRAVFEPALDWQKWQVPAQRQVSLYTQADRARAAEVEAEAQKVIAEKGQKQAEYMREALELSLGKFEEPLREQLRTAYQTPEKERSSEQTQLLKQNPSVNITPGVLYQYLPKAAEELKEYDKKVAEIRSGKPVEEYLRVLTEPPGHQPLARLFHRGDHQQPKQEVKPAGLSVLSPTGQGFVIPEKSGELPTTGRRLAYAQWLTSRDNPLVSRVLVNRVWLHHFGKGLVSTPSDFGVLGGRPTHPELLDWLAGEFMRQGWSLKQLQREILLSTVWRQSSHRNAELADKDPQNIHYWRKPLLRLQAESIRDRMLVASGTLDRTLYGKSLPVKEDETGQVIVDGPQTRRSLYIKSRRSQPVAMLQVFDAPVMDINCECRPVSTVATQSLIMMNGEFVLDQAAKVAERAARDASPLAASLMAQLPVFPKPLSPIWTYGYGAFDETTRQTGTFGPLPHWTGSAWQGGDKLPDPRHGWAILNASGGHPGNPASLSVIRRWTAPTDGTLSISGHLQHGSANGDGVRGRIVSSRQQLLGTWQVHNGKSETALNEIPVQRGETIDLITDCVTNENSDSFNWPVKFTFARANGKVTTYDSVAEFHGPVTEENQQAELLPGQIVQAWRYILGRDPSPSELQLAGNFAVAQLEELYSSAQPMPAGITPVRQVLINVCQGLINSNEFLYIE